MSHDHHHGHLKTEHKHDGHMHHHKAQHGDKHHGHASNPLKFSHVGMAHAFGIRRK